MIRCITRYLFTYPVFLLFAIFPQQTKAWGPVGHAIVGNLAMDFLKPDVRQNVLRILGNMPVDTAANWMDIMRANSDYDFMKPWHYIDFAKDRTFQPSGDENIVNRIMLTMNELRHKKILCDDQIKWDLLILMHLLGDLHQPLHNGYEDDLGGNKVAIQYDTLKTNLHHFWDEDLIRINNITLEDCRSFYQQMQPTKMDTMEGINPVGWMNETRSLLPLVYDYAGYMPSAEYVKNNGAVIKRQLIIAGLRLAAILNKLFASDAPELNMKEVAAKYKNGIEAKDANSYYGKHVTACGRVYGIKTNANVTFINMGEKYPNSPLTIVIFARDRTNFPYSIEEFFADKNISVKGEVVEYKSKAEIIINNPNDIIIEK